MNKIHVTAIALMLGLSGALGMAAASDTVGLRASASQPGVSDAAIAKRQRQLTKAEKALRKARRSKPPALPAVPASRNAARPSAQQVVFQRTAPVVTASSSHGDDDFEDDDHGHHGGHDDHGDDD